MNKIKKINKKEYSLNLTPIEILVISQMCCGDFVKCDSVIKDIYNKNLRLLQRIDPREAIFPPFENLFDSHNKENSNDWILFSAGKLPYLSREEDLRYISDIITNSKLTGYSQNQAILEIIKENGGVISHILSPSSNSSKKI